MSVENFEDDVSPRGAAGPLGRKTVNESFDPETGATKVVRGKSVEEDSVREGGSKGRTLKESTLKLMAALDKPANDEGDADEDGIDALDEAAAVEGEPADAEAAEPSEEGDAGEEGEGEAKSEATSDADEARATNARLSASNARLVAELEAARQSPKERAAHETMLAEAYAAYVDEGSVPAFRKFIGAIVGAAPDSKEVDAELAGVYADLTARELGVPLDETQQAKRGEARARLELARDKREKKAESDKSAANPGEAQQIEQATKYVDNLLGLKSQSGTSIADEFPMLMTLAQDYDGFPPAEVLARAIKHEFKTGELDPQTNEMEAVRQIARKIEKHYDDVSSKIEKARAAKIKSTTQSGVPKKPAAVSESQEQRQKQGARTITNATASVAPGTKPKMKTQKAVVVEKARSDFKTDRAWRDHLLKAHFPD